MSFSAVESPSPAIPGWSAEIYRDLDCDGTIDTGEPVLTAPLGVTTGQHVCLVLRHSVPSGAPAGASELVTLSAAFTYSGASPALAGTVTLDDRTTVINAGNLQITKAVDVATARPGDLIQYTITYRNLGLAPLSAIVIQDATQSFTVFQSASCGTLGAGLTGCSVSTQPAVNGTGTVLWTLVGGLAPGASGTVTFQVRVQ